MKIPFAAILVGSALLSLQANAQQPKPDDHAAHHPAETPTAITGASQQKDAAEPMQAMQGNMQKMRELMAKIHGTKDRAERKRLMESHRQAMHEQMKMMHPMMDGGMMKGGKGHNADEHKEGAGTAGMMGSEMMKQHHDKMMARMDMMQMMMEQMTEHMSAEHEATQSAPAMKK